MEIIINSASFGLHSVFIDDEDYHLISHIKWNIAKGKRTYYVRGKIREKFRKHGEQETIRMHRLIMNCPIDLQIDHKDGNGLNNRKENLRIVSNSQNGKNKKLSIDSKTGYKGVTFIKKKGLYRARIRVDGVLISGGSFKNIYKAALKYNEMAIKYFGEFAKINELTKEQIIESKSCMPLKILKSNKTGYRGVSFLKNKKYSATIFINGKNIGLGLFDSPTDAALSYNNAVMKYNKPLTYLNKI